MTKFEIWLKTFVILELDIGEGWDLSDDESLSCYGDDDIVGDVPAEDVIEVKVDQRKSSTGSQVREKFSLKPFFFSAIMRQFCSAPLFLFLAVNYFWFSDLEFKVGVLLGAKRHDFGYKYQFWCHKQLFYK